jgi:hypothetical protein
VNADCQARLFLSALEFRRPRGEMYLSGQVEIAHSVLEEMFSRSCEQDLEKADQGVCAQQSAAGAGGNNSLFYELWNLSQEE